MASDPTPRHALALQLMAVDPAPAVYVGRPCYHGEARTPPCTPWHWTQGRYGDAVVTSLAAAIDRFADQAGASDLVLIGYSGGGVLAMLLAERLPQVRLVVTLAANLDIDAWCDLHGFSRLTDSLNPAQRPSLPATIRQWHLAGSDDRNVPPALIRRALDRQHDHRFRVLPATDHRCCWQAHWPALLRDFGVPDWFPARPCLACCCPTAC
ncbi:MAG: alpha/beta fold hydrolase, partial [Chromatiaceae bacterium]